MTSNDNNIAINVENVSKVYRLYSKQSDRLKEALHPLRKQYSKEFFALRDISFNIPKGETIGIIGKNGSGKSTLLQILCGIIQPTHGSVQTFGKISSLLELGTGFNPEYTGLENIYLNASIMGLNQAEIDLKLDKIISFAEIGSFIEQPVKTYSSGMYVRLAFAIQANIDPDILIVDEALAVGDAQFVHRCMLRFHQMQKEGKTIILVTHDSSAIKTLCNRALWIDNGQLKSIGGSSKVVDLYINKIFNCVEVFQNQAPVKESSEKSEVGFSSFKKPKLTFDQRVGDGNFEILETCLLSNQNIPISSCDQDEFIQIYLKFINKSAGALTPLAGLILKDPKGIEIASTVSRMEYFTYPSQEPGQIIETVLKVKIPRLYPGPYSITPTISYQSNEGDFIGDRLINALIFEIIAKRESHTLLSLDTSYQVLPITADNNLEAT